ncbi:replication factor A protein [Trifolium repens]|nr:replication factor A protein [Trifolium repens]
MVFNEKANVDSKFDCVADIVPGNENVNSLEMVLVDENGGKIHTSVRKQLIYMFQSKLEEGNVYEMSYFSIFPQKICGHTHDYEYLVDVIGVMTGMSEEREYIRDGKVTKMIVVELTDHSGKCECALRVQFAKIKIFRGKASIQNVINTTRLLINPYIPEVESFKNSIAVHSIDIDSFVSLIGELAKPGVDEEFLR